jgi:hypothetical protein|tara:strand:- start:279 stop:476 length:198 start_codon:yes stop_codon:yes gene_type:complete
MLAAWLEGELKKIILSTEDFLLLAAENFNKLKNYTSAASSCKNYRLQRELSTSPSAILILWARSA